MMRLFLKKVFDPPKRVFCFAGNDDEVFASLINFCPNRAARLRAVFDKMRFTSERNNRTRLTQNGCHEFLMPLRNPAAMTQSKIGGLGKAALKRHCEGYFALHHTGAQRVAPCRRAAL